MDFREKDFTVSTKNPIFTVLFSFPVLAFLGYLVCIWPRFSVFIKPFKFVFDKI